MYKNWQLFISFLKIGTFTIGGGYAMLPLIQKEIVEKKKWIIEKDFLDTLAIAQSVPGAISINTAVFTGYKVNKLSGAIFAVLGCVIPAFLIILIIAIFFSKFNENQYVNKIFKAIRPSVVALMIFSLWKLLKTSKTKWFLYFWSAAVALLIFLLKISPILIILFVIVCSLLLKFIQIKKGK